MYIDPNSGGMLFQVLLVVFGAFSAVILVFSSRIRMAFAKLRRLMRHRANPETPGITSDDETLIFTPKPGQEKASEQSGAKGAP